MKNGMFSVLVRFFLDILASFLDHSNIMKFLHSTLCALLSIEMIGHIRAARLTHMKQTSRPARSVSDLDTEFHIYDDSVSSRKS